MILRKRIFRELRRESVKYCALLLLVTASLTLAIGLGDWTKIIDKTIDETNAEAFLENGEFTLYVPLSKRQISEIADLNIGVEYEPYVDILTESGAELRAFANRKSLNLLVPSEGRTAVYDGEIFIEKIYARTHGISVGDVLLLGGTDFRVCGIGTFPDYCSVRKNLGDVQSDYSLFSVCAVNGTDWQKLRKSGSVVHNYAYRLFDEAEDEDLRDYLAEMDFDENKIDNRYMREIVARYENEKTELYDAIDDLNTAVAGLGAGGDELTRGLRTLTSAAAQTPYEASLSSATEGAAQLTDGLYSLHGGVEELRDGIEDFDDEYLDVDWLNLSGFVKAEDNPRITDCKDDCSTSEAMGYIIGFVLMVLMAYIMSVFTTHRLEREGSVIGTLKALGCKSSELRLLYTGAPLIVTVIGSILGTISGFAAAMPLLNCTGELDYYSVPPLRMAYSPVMAVYGLVMPTVIMLVVNGLAARKTLAKPPLELLRGRSMRGGKEIRLPKMSYVKSFGIRHIIGEKRIYVTMFFGLWISILIMVFGIAMYQMMTDYMNDGANVPYNYMALLAYPPEDVPKNCEEGYVQSLECDFSLTGGTLDIALMGVKDKSDYFPYNLKGNKNDLYLSSAAAEKLGFAKGDKITLNNELTGRAYTFKIKGIVDYNSTLTAFMSLENVRDKFELEDDEFNALFSMKKPNVREGRLTSLVYKGDLKKSAKVFYNVMLPMVVVVTLIGALIFALVLYILMGVAIDRASASIALLKIFGYTKKEISRLYLSGNFYAVIAAILISIPTCGQVVKLIFPYCVANVSANITAIYDIKGKAVTAAITMAVYFAVNALLRLKLNKMKLNEALKNRE